MDGVMNRTVRKIVTVVALTLMVGASPGPALAQSATEATTTLISSSPFLRAEGRLLVHTMPGFRGSPIKATSLLFVPKGTPPEGGWPIVAWVHGTTTPGQKTCAPSLSADLDGDLTRNGFVSNYAFQIGQLVDAGYAVVAPDLEGLGPVANTPHPYYDEASLARSVIAGVRAAREADAALSSRYAVFGHSEGGHGALSVDRHAGEAPELHLVGIVASAPYTSIAATAALSAERADAEQDPAKAQGFRVMEQFQAMMMSVALVAQSPTFDPSTVLGDDLIPVLRHFPSLCAGPAIGVLQAAITSAGSELEGARPGWASTPEMQAFLTQNDPAVTPGFTLRHPTLIVQGSSDEFVLEPLNRKFADQVIDRGGQLTYKVYPGADHSTIVPRANADVLNFFATLFRP